MKQIASGDESHTLYIDFRDEYNEFDIPSSVTKKVYCVTTDTVLVDTTAVTPAVQVTIALTGDLVTLQDSDNKKELKRVCITATDENANDTIRCFEYEIIPSTECYCG